MGPLWLPEEGHTSFTLESISIRSLSSIFCQSCSCPVILFSNSCIILCSCSVVASNWERLTFAARADLSAFWKGGQKVRLIFGSICITSKAPLLSSTTYSFELKKEGKEEEANSSQQLWYQLWSWERNPGLMEPLLCLDMHNYNKTPTSTPYHINFHHKAVFVSFIFF